MIGLSRARNRAVLAAALLLVGTVVYDVVRPGLHWDGTRWVRVDVTAIDAATSRPIPSATITLVFWGNREGTCSSDENGRCSILTHVPAGGRSHFLFERRELGLSNASIEVRAVGYETSDARLEDIRGYTLPRWARTQSGATSVNPITIRMRRKPPGDTGGDKEGR